MSLGTSNRDGGKTSESGHLRALAKMVTGDIITGFNVTQRAAGANMSVDIAIGDAFVRRSDGSYAHPVFNDAIYNQVVSTADGANPRRDIVVLYLDYAQAPSTAVSNNTNGVIKIKTVNGTPAGSAVDPTDVAIQASVGAGNPWTKLARARVPATQTSITNTLIDDLRVMIYANAATINAAAIIDATITAAKLAANSVPTTKIDYTSLPRFRAYRNTSQSSANGAVMQLNATNYDSHSVWNTSTWLCTIPAGFTGVWSWKWNIHSAASNGILSGLLRNGVLVARGAWVQYAGSFIAAPGATDFEVTAGDTFQLQGVVVSGTASVDGGAAPGMFTYMSGHMVSR